MPGVSARNASKNMSRSKRAAASKNDRRVAAAVAEELEACTFGKVIRACGNRMFVISTTEKSEHIAHIRGKMARVSMNDIVLLGEREFESRCNTDKAVYDIMAVIDMKNATKLIKNNIIPSWMTNGMNDEGAEDIFDYSAEGDGAGDSDVDVENI